jgi:hypothetical protein
MNRSIRSLMLLCLWAGICFASAIVRVAVGDGGLFVAESEDDPSLANAPLVSGRAQMLEDVFGNIHGSADVFAGPLDCPTFLGCISDSTSHAMAEANGNAGRLRAGSHSSGPHASSYAALTDFVTFPTGQADFDIFVDLRFFTNGDGESSLGFELFFPTGISDDPKDPLLTFFVTVDDDEEFFELWHFGLDEPITGTSVPGFIDVAFSRAVPAGAPKELVMELRTLANACTRPMHSIPPMWE